MYRSSANLSNANGVKRLLWLVLLVPACGLLYLSVGRPVAPARRRLPVQQGGSCATYSSTKHQTQGTDHSIYSFISVPSSATYVGSITVTVDISATGWWPTAADFCTPTHCHANLFDWDINPPSSSSEETSISFSDSASQSVYMGQWPYSGVFLPDAGPIDDVGNPAPGRYSLTVSNPDPGAGTNELMGWGMQICSGSANTATPTPTQTQTATTTPEPSATLSYTPTATETWTPWPTIDYATAEAEGVIKAWACNWPTAVVSLPASADASECQPLGDYPELGVQISNTWACNLTYSGICAGNGGYPCSVGMYTHIYDEQPCDIDTTWNSCFDLGGTCTLNGDSNFWGNGVGGDIWRQVCSYPEFWYDYIISGDYSSGSVSLSSSGCWPSTVTPAPTPTVTPTVTPWPCPTQAPPPWSWWWSWAPLGSAR